MAKTDIMDVEVVKLTKFGFQNEKGDFIGYSPKMDKKSQAEVVPGRKFSVEMYIADSGKQYVNKVLRQLEVPAISKVTVSIPKVTPEVPKSVKTVNSETMSKAEWADKDTRISRQGVIQAAVQAVSHTGTALDTGALFVEAEALAQLMLAFVNQK